MKKMTMLMVAVFTLVALTGSAFAWPGYVEGKPDELRDGNARGYFIWHDDRGMHLRTTTKGKEHTFTGVIRTDGRFMNVDDFRTEGNDHIKVSRDRDTIWFKFSTAGGLDGLDFRVKGGERIHFDLYMDGHQISRQQIFLGDQGRHPRDNSFTIHR